MYWKHPNPSMDLNFSLVSELKSYSGFSICFVYPLFDLEIRHITQHNWSAGNQNKHKPAVCRFQKFDTETFSQFFILLDMTWRIVPWSMINRTYLAIILFQFWWLEEISTFWKILLSHLFLRLMMDRCTRSSFLNFQNFKTTYLAYQNF